MKCSMYCNISPPHWPALVSSDKISPISLNEVLSRPDQSLDPPRFPFDVLQMLSCVYSSILNALYFIRQLNGLRREVTNRRRTRVWARKSSKTKAKAQRPLPTTLLRGLAIQHSVTRDADCDRQYQNKCMRRLSRKICRMSVSLWATPLGRLSAVMLIS